MNGPPILSIWDVAPVHEGWFKGLSEIVHVVYTLMAQSQNADEIWYGPIRLKRSLPGCPCMPCVRIRTWYNGYHHRLVHGPYG